MAVVTVAIEDLDSWLQAQPENTVDTPYEIEITGLSVSDFPTSSPFNNPIKTALQNNVTKYVDLRSTVIPNTVTILINCFESCSSLVYSPVLSEMTENMNNCFLSCTSLLETPVIPSNVIAMQYTFCACTRITTSPKLPNGVKFLQGCFSGCTSLINTPILPTTVEKMDECFFGCTALLKAPIIPSSVLKMNACFENCTALQYPAIIPPTTEVMYCYENCASILYKPTLSGQVQTDCYYGVPSSTPWGTNQLDTWVAQQNSRFTVVEVKADTKNNCYEMTGREVYGVDISNLTTWLSEQGTNTESTPYEVKVLSLTTSNYNSIKTSLQANSSKYVDLHYTELPSGITSLSQCFYNCSSLIIPPQLPSTVQNISQIFRYCTNLKEAPVIPNGVLEMSYAFQSCESMTEMPDIPTSVSNLNRTFSGSGITSTKDISALHLIDNDMIATFRGCLNLTTVLNLPSSVTEIPEVFYNCEALVNPPTIPSGVTNLRSTFYGCTQLKIPPVLPSGVTSLEGTFSGCTNLLFEPVIPDTVTSMYEAFYNCVNLQNSGAVSGISIYEAVTDNRFQPTGALGNKLFDYANNALDSVIGRNYVSIADIQLVEPITQNGIRTQVTTENPSVYAQNSAIHIMQNKTTLEYYALNYKFTGFPDGVMYYIYKLSDINKDNFFTFSPRGYYHEIGFYTDNTKSTSFNASVRQNDNTDFYIDHYADQSDTFLPTGDYTIIKSGVAFVLSNSVNFEGKINLSPIVTSITRAFYNCSKITRVGKIPATLDNGSEAFKNCTSLKVVEELAISLSSEGNFRNVFQNCPALEQVGHKISVDSDWHVMSLNIGASAVSGKVYGLSQNGVTTTTIPSTNVTKTNLVLPNLTDEILFPPVSLSDADLEDVISDVLLNKYTWWKREAIDPTQKTFVLYADDPENVITNISTNIKTYNTQAEAEADLANLSEGQIIATLEGGDGAVDEVILGDTRCVTSNAVAESLSYSTTEQLTGGKWIDGKPIYRKVIEQNFGTGQTVVTHNLGISRYIDIKVFVGSIQYVNSYLSSQYNISVYDLNVNTFAVTCYSWIGSGYIILEYTKTTD